MKSQKFQLNKPQQNFNDVRITLVYDKISLVQGLQTGWGFACIAEVGETTLLFDTGSDGTILLENMYKLGFDPKKIQLIMISHNRHMSHMENMFNTFIRVGTISYNIS